MRLHALIDLPHACSNAPANVVFLTVLFRDPLCQLRLSRIELLFQPLSFREPRCSITHQCVDSLGQITQHMLESRGIFPQRQIPSFRPLEAHSASRRPRWRSY